MPSRASPCRSAGPSMKTARTPPTPSASSTTSTPRRAAAFSRSAATGSHKGYGLALIVEILSSIIAGGATSNHVSKNGLGDTSQSFFALDYGMFGDKAAMRESLSTLLQELRDSAKAEGRTRIYTSGEMEVDSRNEKLKNGIPVNDSTLAELRTVGGELGLDFDAMVSVKAAE